MSFENINKCCAWRAYHGINNKEWTLEKFKKDITNGHLGGRQAVIFNGAYGSGADVGVFDGSNISKGKVTITKRCNKIKDFINEHELGDVYELPEFQNPGYGMIIPFVWFVNKDKLLKAREEWGGGIESWRVGL